MKKVNSRTRLQKLRNSWRLVFGSIFLLSVAGAGLAAFKNSDDVAHDLSVIGKGVPVVVQIHDPKCPKCLRLRKNASEAIDRMDGQVLIRIADITTPKGRQLQRIHDVPHVTLLLFDGSGGLRNVLSGVRDEDALHRSFLAHVNRREGQGQSELSSQ